MNAIQKPILKCLFATLLLVSFASAGFGDYRNRDESRFIMKPAKPFRPDKDVVTVVMREAIPRGGGYTYQYPRENPEPILTDKYAMEGALSMEIELIASDYSGVAICISGSVDLTPYLQEGVLGFWLKGEQGGERGKGRRKRSVRARGRRGEDRRRIDAGKAPLQESRRNHHRMETLQHSSQTLRDDRCVLGCQEYSRSHAPVWLGKLQRIPLGSPQG